MLLVCFSLMEPDSFTNVIHKWMPEVRHFCPTTPVILVGTKLDLRSNVEAKQQLRDLGKSPVLYSDGLELKARFNAADYVECSAKTSKGVAEVFDAAIRAVFEMEKKVKASRKAKCCII